MAIKANKIIDLFQAIGEREYYITSLIIRYGALKQQLDNPADQSWYFKKGIASREKELQKLKKSFDCYRKEFNESTVDSIIAFINEKKALLDSFTRRGIGLIQSIAIGSFRNSIASANEMIQLKSITDQLNELNFYLENSEELVRLMEVD